MNCDLRLGTEVLNSVCHFMNGLRSLGDIMNALQWMTLKGGGNLSRHSYGCEKFKIVILAEFLGSFFPRTMDNHLLCLSISLSSNLYTFKETHLI